MQELGGVPLPGNILAFPENTNYFGLAGMPENVEAGDVDHL